jgi:hypothetical protein
VVPSALSAKTPLALAAALPLRRLIEMCVRARRIEATELPASPASVARSSPAEAQPGSSADAGLTEAEKMRQRIFQRKAAAAGAGSPAASPEPLRGQVAESSPSADPAAEEDYEEMMRRRRAESILKKKEDEKQDRKNIIKAFHEKAKEKGTLTNTKHLIIITYLLRLLC